MFDSKVHEAKIEQALERLNSEMSKIRTGRAHPGMLDGIFVEAYETKMPLNQVANITVPEPQMLLVTPFDPSNLVAISAAIREDQALGLNPSDDGRVVRVPIPALTEERRRQLVKQVGEKIEETRIAVRNIRQDAMKEIKKLKEDKEISEDDSVRMSKEFDELISDVQTKIDEIFKDKEKDVLTI